MKFLLKTVLPCDVPGHGRLCIEVESQWSTLYQRDLRHFKEVQRRWYWPFYRTVGEAFPGEVIYDMVFEPTPSQIGTGTRRRVSVVNAAEAMSMARGNRPASTSIEERKVNRQEPYQREESTYYFPSRNKQLEENDLDFSRMRTEDPPFQSGKGGDFGGGGATGSWDDGSAIRADEQPSTSRFYSSNDPVQAVASFSADPPAAIEKDFGVTDISSGWDSTSSSTTDTTTSNNDSSYSSDSSASDTGGSSGGND